MKQILGKPTGKIQMFQEKRCGYGRPEGNQEQKGKNVFKSNWEK